MKGKCTSINKSEFTFTRKTEKEEREDEAPTREEAFTLFSSRWSLDGTLQRSPTSTPHLPLTSTPHIYPTCICNNQRNSVTPHKPSQHQCNHTRLCRKMGFKPTTVASLLHMYTQHPHPPPHKHHKTASAASSRAWGAGGRQMTQQPWKTGRNRTSKRRRKKRGMGLT